MASELNSEGPLTNNEEDLLRKLKTEWLDNIRPILEESFLRMLNVNDVCFKAEGFENHRLRLSALIDSASKLEGAISTSVGGLTT
jgi:hypothetical protein